ncbi:MAG: AEC family transporter, partial [Bilifractor sp.]
MASTWVLVSKLGSMMLEAVIGFLIVRLGLVKAEDTGILSRIVVDVFTPCLIINAFQIDITPEKTRGFIAALILSTAYFAVAVLFTWALRKPMHLDAIDRSTIIYPNVGNLIMPLVSMTLGSDMVFYAGAMQIPFNIFVWTHGMSAIRGEKKINLKKAFLNSNMISVFIGLIFLLTGFHTPDVITTVMTGFGDMVGPLSMLVIGMQIATAKLPEVFACRKAYLVIFLRLIA